MTMREKDRFRISDFGFRILIRACLRRLLQPSRWNRLTSAATRLLLLAFAILVLGATAPTDSSTPASTPATPRDAFNAGTKNMGAGKLREAEALLESALASQNERLQPAALYNLGHVRFNQGVEELKKGPSAQASAAMSRMAQEQGEAALRAADEALESNEVQKMVAAYLH